MCGILDVSRSGNVSMETIVKLFGFVFVSVRLALYEQRAELRFGPGATFVL